MGFDASTILPLLHDLHDALLIEGAEAVEWVICGGTALVLQGLGIRSTEDVDVLGRWSADTGEAVEIGAFDPPVERAIARVAAAHPELRGAGRAWVNLSVQPLLRQGLPHGFGLRLAAVRIGPLLTLHLLSRPDLIALKLLAAADDLGRRQAVHLADLQALAPTASELGIAIEWATSLPDPQQRVRSAIKSLVLEMGHEDLAYYI